MKDELARQISGLKHGDHCCLLYNEDPAEQMAALVPYIRQGLGGGERCIYIADDQTPEDVAAAPDLAGQFRPKEASSWGDLSATA